MAVFRKRSIKLSAVKIETSPGRSSAVPGCFYHVSILFIKFLT